MKVATSLANLAGSWSGANHLWMMPGEPAHDSETTMAVAVGSRGAYATLEYTWAEGGEPQEGLLVIGPVSEHNAVSASWIDTFHTGGTFMLLQGVTGKEGKIVLKGSYSVPDNPDWGWQIHITPKPGDTFQFTMYNVSPEGEEYLAVEATYFHK